MNIIHAYPMNTYYGKLHPKDPVEKFQCGALVERIDDETLGLLQKAVRVRDGASQVFKVLKDDPDLCRLYLDPECRIPSEVLIPTKGWSVSGQKPLLKRILGRL